MPPAFVPVVFRYAAHLEQMSWDEFVQSPASTAHALRSARNALDADGLFSWFDPGAEAELLGLTGPRDDDGNAEPKPDALIDVASLADVLSSELLPLTTEMTQRLVAERTGDVKVFAAALGPASLTRSIVSLGHAPDEVVPQVVRWITRFVREQCEAGVDVVVLAEDSPEPVAPFYDERARAFAPVLKVARHYQRACLVLGAHDVGVTGDASALAPIGTSGHLLGDPQLRTDWDAVPVAAIGIDHVPELGPASVYLTSWEVPSSIEPESLVELARHIHSND